MVVRAPLGPAYGLEEDLHQSEANALGRYLVGMLPPPRMLKTVGHGTPRLMWKNWEKRTQSGLEHAGFGIF